MNRVSVSAGRLVRQGWILPSICLAGVLVTVALLPIAAESEPPIALTGADQRPSISLNGDWHTIVDPYATGLYSYHHEIKSDGWFLNRKVRPGSNDLVEYDFAKSPTLKVPGDWNTQRADLFFYEGIVWYQKDFDYQPKPNTRVYLRIGAANYHSLFWINGKEVCEHEGGFTAFACEVTSELKAGSNFIVAAVDNTRHEDGVPTLQTDWWNYGGLTREVSLIELPEAFIDQYDLHLSDTEPIQSNSGTIEGWVHVMGGKPGDAVTVSIPELEISAKATLSEESRAAVKFSAPGLSLWSPDNPKLYKVVVSTASDTLTDQIGFRTITTRGSEILLNGTPIFLRGICIHAEAPYRTGRAYSDQDAATLLGWAKELGANYVRLAHYPHDETMLRAADRMGLLVWAENPVYWAVEFDNPDVYRKAQQQLDEEIDTSRNHPSIILWSMANETPTSPARTQFLSKLVARARELDPTRLITAALLVHTDNNPDGTHTKILDDPLGRVLDVLGANEYIGWYEGQPEAADTTTWRVTYDKPLIMSEFGGGAKAGLHGAASDRWTEEYQANIYRHQLPMLNRIPQLRGISPWVLMDFRSPSRVLTGIQDEFNRKGLISPDGEKKQAFYLLQKAYQDKTVGKAD